MYRVRPAAPGDLDGVLAVARHLDSLNLPSDRTLLAALLARAHASFAGALAPLEREYLFVLEECAGGRIVGTSMIHARHGTPVAPHVYFEVVEEARYSVMLDRRVRRRLLRLGFDEDGPTELGGLVLLPELRQNGAGLGRLLSYARFVFIGAHRAWFRDELLSELLPPLGADGSSPLWDALGRQFTDLSYREADRLSHRGKEFIRALFPAEPIPLGALPAAAQAQVGAVGPATVGVERMLARIGFRFSGRVDPFDGGPHLSARTDEVTLFRTLKRARAVDGTPSGRAGIIAAEPGGRFRAIPLPIERRGGNVLVPADARAQLGIDVGDRVWVQPLPAETNVSRAPGLPADARVG